jgi:hypothetical protein
LGSLALFLDSSGNVQVLSLDSQTVEFSFTSAGSLDAAFLDERNIVLARGVAAANSPFLKVNIVTGETVPLQYPAPAGIRVFRGGGGFFVVIDSEGAVAWHEAGSGKLAASLRIYPDGWVLEKKAGTVRGPVVNEKTDQSSR